MFLLRPSIAALGIVLAALIPGGCAGGGADGGVAFSAPDIEEFEDADPVSGNVRVTWRNLEPRHPDFTGSLVNASSEAGQRLRSGRASSSITKVLEDEEMGKLIKALENEGFFQYATEGLGLSNVPDHEGQKGILVVDRDGTTKGLMLTRNLGGTQIPRVYTDCKSLFLAIHGKVSGYEIRINADVERVFQSPKIRMNRR